MEVSNYLKELLKKSGHYTLTEQDRAALKEDGLEEYIFKKFASKKFRKWKLQPECEARTKNAVQIKVSQNKPITALYFQGGYKLWRFPSSPEVDWAEFFNLAYVLSYLAPIAAAYKPGVILTYFVHTLVMEKHDNLTTEEIKEYMDSFKKLIAEFQKHLPKNITISILRDMDLYTREEYFSTLEEGKNQAEKVYEELPPSEKQRKATMSLLNIKWKGKEDWSILSESEKQEKVRLAALYEMAVTSNLKRVFETAKSPENVLLFTIPTKDFIGIGSTRTSIAKHWVGFGVLESENGKLYERILTPSQFEKLKEVKHEETPVTLLTLKNLKTIRVYNKRLDFLKK